MNAKLNQAVEHIRLVCEDNANSPNPDLVIKFIASIVQNALAHLAEGKSA